MPWIWVKAAEVSNQSSLFGGGEDLPPPRPALAKVWMPAEKLAEERAAIGFYLSGHPLDDYLPALRRKGAMTLAEVQAASLGGPLVAQIAGTVAARAEKKSAKGTRYAFVTLSDPTGLYEATVFSDVLDAHRALLEPGMNVLLTVNAEPSGDQVKMLARSVQSLEDAVADAGSGLLAVEVADPRTAVAVLDRLRETSAEMSVSAKGRGPLLMRVREGTAVYDIEVGQNVPVTPKMRQALRAVEGVIDVTEE